MTEDVSIVNNSSNSNQISANDMQVQPHPSILNQTLGQLLQNNQQAQGVVMQAMQISPQQLQQLLGMTGNNQLMNQTIGDLFKNGTISQASGQVSQVSPQQFQQILGVLNPQNPQVQIVGQEGQMGQAVGPQDKVPYTIPASASKSSLMQKLKSLFK